MSQILEVEQVAVLSTMHMPTAYPDFGGLSINEFDEGYSVYVSTPEGLAGVEIPEWLAPIVAACHMQDIRRLIFDCDGHHNQNFKTYEW